MALNWVVMKFCSYKSNLESRQLQNLPLQTKFSMKYFLMEVLAGVYGN